MSTFVINLSSGSMRPIGSLPRSAGRDQNATCLSCSNHEAFLPLHVRSASAELFGSVLPPPNPPTVPPAEHPNEADKERWRDEMDRALFEELWRSRDSGHSPRPAIGKPRFSGFSGNAKDYKPFDKTAKGSCSVPAPYRFSYVVIERDVVLLHLTELNGQPVSKWQPSSDYRLALEEFNDIQASFSFLGLVGGFKCVDKCPESLPCAPVIALDGADVIVKLGLPEFRIDPKRNQRYQVFQAKVSFTFYLSLTCRCHSTDALYLGPNEWELGKRRKLERDPEDWVAPPPEDSVPDTEERVRHEEQKRRHDETPAPSVSLHTGMLTFLF